MKSSNHGAIAAHAAGSLSPRPKTLGDAIGIPRSGKFHRSIRCAGASEARSSLTTRENEVMRHMRKGLLYKEIADKMGISFSTVHKLQHKIFVKLQVSNRTEAINEWKNGDRT